MGKRELLFILAFAIVGVVTYRATAPPSEAEGEGFSFGQMFRSAVANLRGQNATAEVSRTTAAEVPAEVTRLIVPGFSGQLTIVGEDRDDVSAELSGTVFGYDDAEARGRADLLTVNVAVNGDAISLDLERPESRRRPRIDLKVAIPRRLSVQVDAEGGRLEVRGVAGVALDTRRVETTLVAIAGAVSGEQRDGAIEIAGAEGVSLTSRRVSLRFEQIAGPITGEFTDGRLLLRESTGPVTLDTRRVSVELDLVEGDTKLTATDGRLVLRNQRGPIEFEGERASLTATLANPQPIVARSTDATIEVTLAPGEGASLDLEADEGRIRLPQDDLAPTTEGRVERLQGEIGGGGPTIRIRTTRAGIVIRR